MGTRASSSSPVRLATRSVHTQGGYALWAHGPPSLQCTERVASLTGELEEATLCVCSSASSLRRAGRIRPVPTVHTGLLTAPQSGSPHALYTPREDTHCGAHGPPPCSHSAGSHTALYRACGEDTHCGQLEEASSSCPQCRLAHTALYTRREDTHCGHTRPPPAPSAVCTERVAIAGGGHVPPHSAYTERVRSLHWGTLGRPVQCPSQARHTLCTHAGRIRTVGTRASSISPVRLARRSGDHAGRIRTVRHTGLLSAYPPCAVYRAGEPDWGAGPSPQCVSSLRVHTQGGYGDCEEAHGPPVRISLRVYRASSLTGELEDTHCAHSAYPPCQSVWRA